MMTTRSVSSNLKIRRNVKTIGAYTTAENIVSAELALGNKLVMFCARTTSEAKTSTYARPYLHVPRLIITFPRLVMSAFNTLMR